MNRIADLYTSTDLKAIAAECAAIAADADPHINREHLAAARLLDAATLIKIAAEKIHMAALIYGQD